MATEELNPASENAHGDELPRLGQLGQIGAHGADPNGDAGWLAAQAQQIGTAPTHNDQGYTGMSRNPPGSGTHAAHAYDEYKHKGAE